MSDYQLTDHRRANMLRDLDGGISKLRYELTKNLAEIDVLKKEKVENVLSVFNERLTVFQHDFLQMLAQVRGGAPNKTEDVDLGAAGNTAIPTLVGGLAGAAVGGAAAGMTVSTFSTGMLWWSSVHAVSLATMVAGAAGVSATVATGGLALGGGIAGAVAVNKGIAGFMRKRIRNKITEDFDSNVAPKLRTWAAQVLNE